MAVLALGAVGAIGGAAFGATTLGLVAGLTVGQLLFPPSIGAGNAPRLGDLSVSSSAYGNFIPISFGTVRNPGQLIWGLPIEERKQRVRAGKGGLGGGRSQDTYSYFGNVAFSFGEGIAEDILKIWFDGKLVYDKTGTIPVTSAQGDRSINFRFYKGDEDQLPDPLIEADKGVGSTPAYRGQAYIVFEDLALKDYGNRIPQVTAEITYKRSAAASERYPQITPVPFTGGSNPPYNNTVGVDWDHNLWYSRIGNSLTTYSITDMRQRSANSLAPPGGVQFLEVHSSVKDIGGALITYRAGNSQPIGYVDPETYQVNAFPADGSTSNDVNNTTGRFVQPLMMCSIRVFHPNQGYEYYAFSGSIFNDLGLIQIPNMEYVWHGDVTTGNVTCVGAGGEFNGYSDLYAGSTTGGLFRIRVTHGAFYSVLLGGTRGIEFSSVRDFPGEYVRYILIDEVDNNPIIWVTNRLIKIDKETAATIWETKNLGAEIIDFKNINQSRIRGQRLVVRQGLTSVIHIVNTSNGDVLTVDTVADVGTGSNNIYSSDLDALLATYQASTDQWRLLLVDRGAGLPDTLSNIVKQLATRVGYNLADLDTTELTDNVQGFALGRQTSLRNVYELLTRAYFFEGIQSDYQIKFLKKDKAVSVTIDTQRLIPLDAESNVAFQNTYTQETELPVQVEVAYFDKNGEYQAGLQRARRTRNPVSTNNADGPLKIELPIVLTADEAKQISEKTLYQAWFEREGFKLRAPTKFLEYDPGDVINIGTGGANIKSYRIINATIGGDLSIEMDGTRHDSANFVSTSEGSVGDKIIRRPVPSTLTDLLLLDIPLLRPLDDTNGLGLLLHMVASSAGFGTWPGAVIHKGVDAFNFEPVEQILREVVRGVTVSVLGDTERPFATDEANTLQFRLTNGDIDEFSSVTQLEMLNGANAMLVGNEIIQFRTVSISNDQIITVSNLLRGRRGTDGFTGEHALNERVILLQTATINSITLDVGELNATRFYKAVGFKSYIQEITAQTFASTGAAEKPFSVVHLTATPNGSDIDFTWVRRTRLDGSLIDGVGEVPLGEASELYDIEILDRVSEGILKTVTALTTTSYTLTAADISTIKAGGPFTALTVVNPGAETGNTTGWTLNAAHGNNSLTTTTTQPHSGTRSFRITEFSLRAYYYQDIVPSSADLAKIVGGQNQLTLKWWGIAVPRGDGKTNQQTMRIECYDSNDALIANSTNVFHRDQTYTQYTLNLTAPTNTARIRIHILMDREGGGHSDNDAKVYLDDITLEYGFPATDKVIARVYQISNIVGRGFPRSLDVDL